MPKIARHYRDIVITEKIDGTNASILINDEGVFSGSKSRLITPGKSTDNFGFASWVESHKDELSAVLGPGLHRGEWWGRSIQRGYGLSERYFSLFNVSKWRDLDLEGQLPKNVTVVPMMYKGPNDDHAIQRMLEILRTHGSYAAPGFRNPEGTSIACYIPTSWVCWIPYTLDKRQVHHRQDQPRRIRSINHYTHLLRT